MFGFTSYWQASKLDLKDTLKAGGARGARGTFHNRMQSVLVVAEAALSLMLLVGAGLLMETLYYLHQQKLGFDPRHVYTMATPFAPAAKLTAPQIWTFQQEVLRRIRMASGVVSAAAINQLPLLSGPNNLPTQQEGRPEHSIGGMEYRATTPEYFQTMHIPIIQGRGFQETDSLLVDPGGDRKRNGGARVVEGGEEPDRRSHSSGGIPRASIPRGAGTRPRGGWRGGRR